MALHIAHTILRSHGDEKLMCPQYDRMAPRRKRWLTAATGIIQKIRVGYEIIRGTSGTGYERMIAVVQAWRPLAIIGKICLWVKSAGRQKMPRGNICRFWVWHGS